MSRPAKYATRRPQAVRIMKDGREITNSTPAGRAEYHKRKMEMWERDKGICCLCGGYIIDHEATFEHKKSRGMGGSRRDDRIEFNGVSHYYGNRSKGSMSYDLYMQKPIQERMRICMG